LNGIINQVVLYSNQMTQVNCRHTVHRMLHAANVANATNVKFKMIKNIKFLRSLGLGLGLSFVLVGCAVNGDPRDPIEPVNRAIYQFNDGVDRAVLKPVAEGYKTITPHFVQTGVRNFFSNLDDVTIIANDILQLKLEQTTRDFMRLTFNTTFGFFGLLDIASEMGLQKNNEDFGQTLGRWGVGTGPYIVLPFLGPSNVRDTIGSTVDGRHTDLVRNYDDVSTRNAGMALRLINRRAELLGVGTTVDAAALDNYEFTRDFFLERRRGLVYDGNPPREKFDD
jgi:phospholipid-binding lipoprotein MlaA